MTTLKAVAALSFFGKTGLDKKAPGTLRNVCELGDASAPHGQLTPGPTHHAGVLARVLALPEGGP